MAEILAAQQKAKFGSVKEISAVDYVDEVNKAGEGVWVVLHLYKPGYPLVCYCFVVVISLLCCCLSLLCCCHFIALLLSFHCCVVVISLLCCCHFIALLSFHCCVVVISLLCCCHCHHQSCAPFPENYDTVCMTYYVHVAEAYTQSMHAWLL